MSWTIHGIVRGSSRIRPHGCRGCEPKARSPKLKNPGSGVGLGLRQGGDKQHGGKQYEPAGTSHWVSCDYLPTGETMTVVA